MFMINLKIKLKQIWDKYQLIILIALASVVLSIMVVFSYRFLIRPKVSLEHYSNLVYTVQYDSTWKLIEPKQNKLALQHNDARINIEITTLNNDYLYMSLEKVVDEISYAIVQDNPNYSLIGKQKTLVTVNQYDGYQLLYENGENEVLLTLFKKENMIVSIVYEAPYEDFDILLDSVKEIIHNFQLKNEEYALTHNLLEVGGDPLSLIGNGEIEVSYTVNYKIANSHYQVEYEVPNNFVSAIFNSRYNLLNYEGLTDGSITLTAMIYEYNLYEILEKMKSYSFDYSIEMASKEGKIGTETYTKLSDEQYIYHVMYDYNGIPYDVAYLIYKLDYRRVFVIKLLAQNCNLSEDLVQSINIINSTKYANYVQRNIEDDKLVNELRYVYTDSTDYRRKFSQVNFYIPMDYRELDDGFSNMYETRIFNNNFNEDSGVYDFEVRYSINSLSIDGNLNILESSYYDAKNRKSLGTKTYNDKKFKVYTYNEKNSYVYILFYKLDCGKYLQIIIESNGVKISNDKIIELTKFDEKIYVMN